MDFKFLVFTAIIVTTLWSLSVSGFISVEDLGSIKLNSELPGQTQESNFEDSPLAGKFDSLVSVLNLAIPLTFLGVVLLVITYGNNPIGIIGLAIAIGMFALSYSRTMRAVDIIKVNSEYSLDARVWWM